jgi:hypothetical protein
VLHYFQDLGYAEMAARLHIAEPAARKRVSRALGALEQQLARRGTAASAIGLLAGATALQAGVPAHTGLAAAALNASGSAAPALLTFTTIMSHTTTKIAAVAILLAAVPVVITSQANSRLRADTAAAVQASSDATPARQSSGNVRENPASSAKNGEVLALSNQLAAEQTRRKLAEDKVATLTQQIERARNEVVVSLGQIEDIARRLASFGRIEKEFEQRKSVAPPDERAKLAEEFAAKASSMFPEVFTLSNELPKIESSPEKAGRFYATLIGELAELTPAQRDAVAKAASNSFESMRQLGVTAGQRPAKENAAWTAARTRAINAMQEAILQVLPSDKRDRSLLLEGPMDFISDPWHWDSQREGEKK